MRAASMSVRCSSLSASRAALSAICRSAMPAPLLEPAMRASCLRSCRGSSLAPNCRSFRNDSPMTTRRGPLLPIAALAATLVATMGGAWLLHAWMTEREQAQFEGLTQESEARLAHRVETYVALLRS